MQLSLFGLLLLTQPLNLSEQDTRANLEFSSNFAIRVVESPLLCIWRFECSVHIFRGPWIVQVDSVAKTHTRTQAQFIELN